MALSLAYDAHTEIGLVRSNNEDSAYVSPRMLMVADGMGGAAAGDLASAVAVWELRRTDENLPERIATARADRLEAAAEEGAPEAFEPGDLADVLTVMAGTLAHANDRLVQLVEDDPTLSGMGTTVCGFVLSEDRLGVVNIGDSRAYLVRDGEMHRVTHDHSWVQTLVDDGSITEEEALEHPHRSLVLRVLNGSTEHEPDLGWLEVRAGDRLMVCSDGLCGLVTDTQIAPVLTAGRPRSDTIEELVALAHQAGGYDNITIVLADVEQDGPPGAVAVLGSAAATTMPAGQEHTAPLALIDDEDVHPLEAQERFLSEDERYALAGQRRWSSWLKLALAFLLPVVAVAGGATVWYQYTQTRLFIGPDDAQVALYQGIPETVFGQSLSTLLETSDTRIADLPPYYAERVRATIPVESRSAAQATLDELRTKAAQCIAQREERARSTPSPTPTPTPTPTPGGTATAAPSASVLPAAVVTPSPSPTPITAPEDC